MVRWSETHLYEVDKEINGALQESTHFLESDGVKERWLITDQIDCARNMLEIDNLTRNVIRSKLNLFSLKENSQRKQARATKLGKQFLDCLNMDIERIKFHYPNHKFSPFFDLYEEHIASKGLTAILFNESTVEYFNDCINSLRAGAKSKRFKSTLDHCKRLPLSIKTRLLTYVRGLHDFYSKLLVIRLDLGYQKQFCGSPEHIDPVSYSEVRGHRKSFLKYLKQELPEDYLAGYAWKLEHGKIKSYHYHFILLLNGQRVREDITIAKIIGEHWKNIITNGKGLYFNCNAKKFNYRSCGIGMISHDDAVMRKNLEEAVLTYLVKVDFYIKLFIQKGRAFGKGALPKESRSGIGRPRKATSICL
ncbi:MAG: YagK/YfjJ domain-containing protein [Arenimonas sp.]